MAITMKEVAERCGVSIATVSLALSGSERIPEDTRERILKIVEEMGYRRHALASALAKNSTKLLAAVVPQLRHIFEDPYFGEAMSGIYDAAQELGYKILLEVASPQFMGQKSYLHLFQEKRIDGMLYIGSTAQDTYLADFLQYKFPFVQVGSYLPDYPLHYVTGDNVQGGYLATRHLISLGHKNIGMITGHFGVISARDRHEGYKKALTESGIEYDENLVVFADFREHTGYTAMQSLLKQGPTAVFCGNDLMAIGAIRAVKKAGLHVPYDVAIMGMDNIRLGEMISPALSTVKYDVYTIAQRAAQRLIEIVEALQNNEPEPVKPVAELVPVELMIRDSCGYRAMQSESLRV